MEVTIKLAGALRGEAGGLKAIQVQADNVGQCLEQMEARLPGARKRLRDETGKLRSYVNITVNGQDLGRIGGLDSSVKDGDVITIVVAPAF